VSRRVGGVPQALAVSPSWPTAAVIWLAQGHGAASRSRSRRPLRASRPATAKMRGRSRFGSQRRAFPARASIWVQVSAAHDQATIAHTVNAVAEAMPAYLQALQNGIGTVLRGRSVRPTLRSRG